MSSGRQLHRPVRTLRALFVPLALATIAPQIAAAQTWDEPAYAFSLRTPPGFTGSKSVDGGAITWKLRNEKSDAALGANELVTVTVSALERTPGVDPEKEFRDYVAEFASDILHGGSVEDFRPARFSAREGFAAMARGSLATGAGLRPAVAKVLLMEVGDNHILISAIALGAGDKAYADVATPNGVFRPVEAAIEAGRPASPAGSSSPTTEASTDAVDLLMFGLLGLGALVGGGLVIRMLLNRRVATARMPAPPPQTIRIDAVPPVPPPETASGAPQSAPVAAATARFCTECGAPLTAPGPCKVCGAQS